MNKRVIYIIIPLFIASFLAGLLMAGGWLREKEEKEKSNVEISSFQLDAAYPSLDSGYRERLLALREERSLFQNQLSQNKNPLQDFMESDFLKDLESFFGSRESLKINPVELESILGQDSLWYRDSEIAAGGRMYKLRVIGYAVDFYVQALTDRAMSNKWVWVQCYDDESFYFSALSEGNNFYLEDCITLEWNGNPAVILMGKEMSSIPYTVDLKAFCMKGDSFQRAELFPKGDRKLYRDSVWTVSSDGYTIKVAISEERNRDFAERSVYSYWDEKNQSFCFLFECSEGEKTHLWITTDGKISTQ